eukprot:s2423_g12.t4
MSVVSGCGVSDRVGLEGFPSRLKEEGPRPATDGPALSGEASSKASDWVHGSTSVSHVAGSQTSTAASSGAAGANRKGSSAGSTGKHDGRSVPLTPHSGPGAEGDPPGTLLGAENLPMVGAAGVLALPKRQQLAEQAPEKPTKKSARLVGADASDLLAAGELHGWGGDYEDVPPYQLYDLSKAERKFKRYVEEATKASDREWVAEDGVDLDQVRVLTMGQPDPKPVQGPGILQLAKERHIILKTQLVEKSAQSAMLSGHRPFDVCRRADLLQHGRPRHHRWHASSQRGRSGTLRRRCIRCSVPSTGFSKTSAPSFATCVSTPVGPRVRPHRRPARCFLHQCSTCCSTGRSQVAIGIVRRDLGPRRIRWGFRLQREERGRFVACPRERSNSIGSEVARVCH